MRYEYSDKEVDKSAAEDNDVASAGAQIAFSFCGGADGKLSHQALVAALDALGIRKDNARAKIFFQTVAAQPNPMSLNNFVLCRRSDLFVAAAMDNHLSIPRFDKFSATIKEIYQETKGVTGGHVASYIPQLARVSPSFYGVSVCTRDGQQASFGDSKTYFCVQSVSKAITYAIVLEEHGEDLVHKHVGREPSGVGFNERVLNADSLPHNPCINSGAIMCASLVKPEWTSQADRFDFVLDYWQRLATGRPTFANSTYLSERATADRNFCLAYMMQEENVFPEGTDLVKTLELYFMLCSIEVTSDMLAVAAATFANGGVNPMTGERIFSERTVRSVLSIVSWTGMYDASGQHNFSIGIPCKSGVSGAILCIVPGILGLALFSPRLDSHGNSVRGNAFLAALVSRFNFHQYEDAAFGEAPPAVEGGGDDDDDDADSDAVVDVANLNMSSKAIKSVVTTRKVDPTSLAAYGDPNAEKASLYQADVMMMWYAAAVGDFDMLRTLHGRGVRVTVADYDARTPLALAASEGHKKLVEYLLAHGADYKFKDRFGNTALDDAKRGNFSDIVALLEAAPAARYAVDYGSALPASAASSSAVNHSIHRLFRAFDTQATGVVRTADLRAAIERVGLPLDSSRHLQSLSKDLQKAVELDEHAFAALFGVGDGTDAASDDRRRWLLAALLNEMTVPNFPTFVSELQLIFDDVRENVSGGKNASYIPQLATVDSSQFAMGFVSVSGQQVAFGDSDTPFCIQSMTKVISYCIAQDLLGFETVRRHVGVEPSGRNFNELVLDNSGLPHNPFINAGAIMTASLIYPEREIADRFTYLLSVWKKLTGGEDVAFDNATYLSERATAWRNWTLAYMMLDRNAFPAHTSLQDTLDFYFMTCSLLLTTKQMASVAATLANAGVNPFTHERVFSSQTVKNTLSVMSGCGMYDFSGEWAYHIGLPAKSGVGGGIMAVVPDVGGFVTWSPPLDKLGNSVKGIEVFKRLSKRFNFHVYETEPMSKMDVRLHDGANRMKCINELIDAASVNDVVGLRTAASRGVDVNAGDYDGRRALHVAACEGAVQSVRALLHLGASLEVKDRWGSTPYDDAVKNEQGAVMEVFEKVMSKVKKETSFRF